MRCEQESCPHEAQGQCLRCGLYHCATHGEQHLDIPCGPRIHPNMRRHMNEILADLVPRMRGLWDEEPEEQWIQEFYARCYDPNEVACMSVFTEGHFDKPFTVASLLFAAESLEEHPEWKAEDVDMEKIYGYTGSLLYEIGRFSEAESSFRKAVGASSMSADRWDNTVGLAASAKEAGHWSVAADSFAQALEHSSDASPEHMLFGQPARDAWPPEKLRKEQDECSRKARITAMNSLDKNTPSQGCFSCLLIFFMIIFFSYFLI